MRLLHEDYQNKASDLRLYMPSWGMYLLEPIGGRLHVNTTISTDFTVTEGRSGWLARSADRKLGLAVVGETREEAEQRFRLAVQRRSLLLQEDETPASPSS